MMLKIYLVVLYDGTLWSQNISAVLILNSQNSEKHKERKKIGNFVWL